MTETRHLVVGKMPPSYGRLAELIKVLAHRYRMDSYTARQRLVGAGPSFFAKGQPDRLKPMASLLKQYGFTTWILQPTAPRFAPLRVRNFTPDADGITFFEGDRSVRFERGERVLALLSDLSGTLVDRHLKRMMVRNTYLGSEGMEPMDSQEAYRTVLRSQPVFDLYLLRPDHTVRAAVRIFAGRYNPEGLGEKATYSAAGNMKALIELVRSYAGEFELRTDFGLASLPGCQLKRGDDEATLRRENLRNLTRFGWYMADLSAQDKAQQDAAEPGVELPLIAALEVLDGPLDTALRPAGVSGSGQTEDLEAAPEPVKARGLPPPPTFSDRPHVDHKTVLKTAVGIVAAGTFFATQGEARFLEWLLRYGLLTGAIPAALSAGFLVLAVGNLRLKRKVENTPTSRIRSMAMGLVEVQGRAVRQYALVSPVSQLPCVYYRLRRFRRKGTEWEMTRELSSGPVPFLLEDDTGRVSIDPGGAAMRPRTRQEGTGDEPTLFGSAPLGDSNERWVEEVIPEGTFLHVLGYAAPKRAQRPTLRQRTAEALRDMKLDPSALHKYDRDGDGRISAEEWDEARAETEQRVLHESLSEKRERRGQHEQVVIGKAPRGLYPFVVAETESEAHLTRSYAVRMSVLGGAGVVLAAFSLVLFLRNVVHL